MTENLEEYDLLLNDPILLHIVAKLLELVQIGSTLLELTNVTM